RMNQLSCLRMASHEKRYRPRHNWRSTSCWIRIPRTERRYSRKGEPLVSSGTQPTEPVDDCHGAPSRPRRQPLCPAQTVPLFPLELVDANILETDRKQISLLS